MSKSLPPQTPTRRSRRFQPLATPIIKRNEASKLECIWAGEPIFVRPTEREQDLLQEDLEGGEGGGDDVEQETVFYASFKLKSAQVRQYRGKNASRRANEGFQTYRVGDTITVQTDTLYRQKRPPSVAVISAMWEVRSEGDDGEGETQEHDPTKMRLRVHWFLRPTELAAIREKREHEENEIYCSIASSDILTPDVIISGCDISSSKSGTIMTKQKWVLARNKKRSKRESDEEEDDEATNSIHAPSTKEKFYCRFAVNPQRGIYYDFSWEDHHAEALDICNRIPESTTGVDSQFGHGAEWNVPTMECRTKKDKPPRKKQQQDNLSDAETVGDDVDSGSDAEIESGGDNSDEEMDDVETEDSGDEPVDDGLANPQTPSRKRSRKRGQETSLKTPRKARKTVAQPTPHSKAALKRRRGAGSSTTRSPRKKRGPGFVIRPPTLSFKTDMSHLPRDPWLRAMHMLHVGNRPDALPCREEEYEKVLRCVGDLLEEGSGGCVYISGVPGTGKTATVHTVVRELKRMAESNEINPFTYVEINGLRIPEPPAAYSLLWEAIVRNDDSSVDSHLRIGPKESLKALTHHFSGRNRGPSGHAYVVLMDELDQLVTPKQDVIYNFFNWPTLAGSNLVVIAVANTMDLPERVMTGRVRSRLGMTRINFQPYTTNQLEQIVHARLATAKEGLDEPEVSRDVMAKDAVTLAARKISRITGDARRVLDTCRRVVEYVNPTKTTALPTHVTKVLSAMQSSPTAGYLHECSLHERMMLASLIKCIKREGVEEIKWSEVQYQHLNYVGSLTSDDDPKRKPTPAELTMVLDSLVASRAVLLEDGSAVARKPEGERRLLLNIEQIEVERVLSDVGGSAWKALLST